MRKIVTMLSLPLLLAGCAPQGRPTAAKVPDPVKIQMTPPKVSDGSLWQEDARANASLTSDLKARNKGDVVTILVIEKVDAKRARKTSTSKDMGVDASADNLFYPGIGQLGGNSPKVGLTAKRSFDGGGSITDSGEVSATLAGQVLEVLPNGNLVLTASKEVTVAGEVQVVTLTGIARQQDVTPANQVLSTNLAEARIHISGTGPLNDAQRRSLVTRLFDWVNLF
jgi:flagellar L-ring protein precursor FlgH